MGQSSPGVISDGSPHGFMPTTGLLICLTLGVTYVGSLYGSPYIASKFGFCTTLACELWWKVVGTFCSSLFSLIVARVCLEILPPPQPNCLSSGQILGVSFDLDSFWWDFIFPVLITLLLLLPLMMANALTEMFTKFLWKPVTVGQAISWYALEHAPTSFQDAFYSILCLKPEVYHQLVVGPLSEEFCYRSAMVTILRMFGGWTIWPANIVQSIVFALSHAHQFFVAFFMPHLKVEYELTGILLQCGFTLVFGLYVGHLYIRSRSIWTCYVIHLICNWVGFPDVDLVFRLPGPLLLMLGGLGGLCTAVGVFLLRLL